MSLVDGGIYIPLYKESKKEDLPKIQVPAFWMDQSAVTQRQFLHFVRTHPAWRKSQVSPLFAESTYLSHWTGDLSFRKRDADRPVTFVSWFAAQAYCEWKQKRLPTLSEWELAASASETHPAAADDPAFIARILAWYAKPSGEEPNTVPFRNYWHIYDLHGRVWEWVYDFNSALVTGESRADSDLDRTQFCGGGAASATDFKNYGAFMRFAFRSSLEGKYALANLGFRCVKDVQPTHPEAKK
jgi:formylglycine-generating enzyme required for sulfatase activity